MKKCILVISRDDFIHMLGNLLNLHLNTEGHNIFQLLFLSYRRNSIAVFIFRGAFYITIGKREYDLKEIKFCLYAQKILKSAAKYMSVVYKNLVCTDIRIYLTRIMRDQLMELLAKLHKYE